jgi:cell division septum initiation protein DivIVA
MNGQSFLYRHATSLRMIAVVLVFVLLFGACAMASQTSTPPAEQSCEKIKQDIEQLQQELADLSAEMQRETGQLDQLNKAVAQTQADLNVATAHANAGLTNENLRGQLLDTLAHMLGLRKQLKQQLEDDAELIQEIKAEIANLLSKLANCALPSTTQPPKGTLSPQLPPPSSPAPSSTETPPNQPPPPTPAPAKKPAGQDCEKIKQDIEQLQQELADLSAEMQRETEQLDQLNKAVAQTQADLNVATAHANAGLTNENLRGQLLDTLAHMLGLRKQLKQQLEDDAELIQEIKAEIADLLSKLANCGPPSTTAPSKEETPNPQPPPPIPEENKKVSFQLRGFGGATIVNGNAPSTAGFDGAVLFPLGNRVLVGPTAGFQWVNSSIVSSIGSMTPGSTFANTGVGFNEGNFGGEVDFFTYSTSLWGKIGNPERNFWTDWEISVEGGATVANSTITQQSGFCGLGNATSPAGCTVTSTTTTHDTVTGPFVGGYISHSIFPHVRIFAGYDYHFELKARQPNQTNPTGPPTTTFDVHNNSIYGGFSLQFPRAILHAGRR